MTKFSVGRPIYGRLAKLIESDHPDYIERLSEPELRACIRADFSTPECFSVLSKLNCQLRFCRETANHQRNARKR